MVKIKIFQFQSAVNKMRFTPSVLLHLVFLCCMPFFGLEAQASSKAVQTFPDHLKLRSEFLSAVVTAAPERALAFPTTYRATADGRVRISVERDDTSFFVMFLRERDGEFPYGSRGNVIVKRDAKTGYMTRVIWYLGDDGRSWISLVPRNERTIVDFVVAGVAVREGYVVSRLVYQLFTNTFSNLYESTKAGLDWSLVLGEPGPSSAALLAEQIVARQRHGSAGALLEAASDFTLVGRYLSAAGAGDREPVEETSVRHARISKPGNPRDPSLLTVPKYSDERGIPVEAIPGTLLAEARKGAAFIALIEGVKGSPASKLALVPYFDTNGNYTAVAIDTATNSRLELAEFIQSRGGAYARLFRLPLPAAPL